MQLTARQIEEVLAKKPESRYKYFIRTVCAEEEVWGLADEEGWLMLEDDDDNTDVIPVFPMAVFATAFLEKSEFSEYSVQAIDLWEFLQWFEDFEKEKIKIAVFPTPDFQCAVMPPHRLKADFEAQFDKEAAE